MPKPAVAPTMRPIESPFGAADDPVAIARGLLAVTGSPVPLYRRSRRHRRRRQSFRAGPRAELRAARHHAVDRCRLLRCRRLRLLAAARRDAGDRQRESRRRSTIGATFMPRSARASCSRSISTPTASRAPTRCSTMPRCGLGRVIAMTLRRVGTDRRPRHGSASSRSSAWPQGRAIFAAGGVGTRAISTRSRLCGAHGALLATALHTQCRHAK